MIGLLVGTPFLILALVGGVTAAVRFLRARRARLDPPPPVDWRWRWIRGALALGLVGTAVPLLVMSGTTMRYAHDFASLFLICAVLAGWRLLALPRTPMGRASTGAAYVGLASVTLVIGVLFGFTGYFVHFARHNPALLHTLERALSLCGR